jgi:hypothetical protein
MEEKKYHQLLGCFLREKMGETIMFVVFAAIAAAVFALYDLEMEPVCYAFSLCVLLYVVWLGIRFVRYCREEKERRELLQETDGGNGNRNSKPAVASTLAEREYREMLETLGERCRALATDWQKERQESLDYYSTWVHQIKTPIAVMRMQLQGEDTDENRMWIWYCPISGSEAARAIL